MLFLWIFGNNVEDAIGRVRFLLFYLARRHRGDGAPDVRHAPSSATRGGASIPNLGASGAISGVLGAYFVLLPRASVLTLDLPSSFFARSRRSSSSAIWFAFQALAGRTSRSSTRTGAAASRSSRTSAASSSGVLTVQLFQARASAAARATDGTAFEEHVRRALDSLPPQLARGARERRGRRRGREPGGSGPVRALRGRPADRAGVGLGPLPDRITIYRLPLEESFARPAELEDEIRITVLHELAHYFGHRRGPARRARLRITSS